MKLFRSSRPEVFYRKGVLRNFAKYTGKYRPEACNFIKKETLAQVFSSEFCEISKNTFFYRTPPMVAFDFLGNWLTAFSQKSAVLNLSPCHKTLRKNGSGSPMVSR